MKEDEEELVQLKKLYEELWHDAKSLVKDMQRSIMIYLYSAVVTFAVAVLTVLFALLYFLVILQGNASIFHYVGAIVEAVGSIVIIVFGAKLLNWYFIIKKRYSKLTEIERTIED